MTDLDARTRRIWAEVFGGLADLITQGRDRPAITTGAKRTTPFASVPHALAEMVAVSVDGFSQSSVSDPARIEALTGALGGRTATAPGESRATSQADNLVHVRTELERLFAGGPWDGVAALTPEVCRLAVLLRLVGRKPGVEVAEMIAERLPEEDRPLVTQSRVARMVRYARAELRAAFERRELIERDEHPDDETTAGQARDTPDDRRVSGVHPVQMEDDMREWLTGWGPIAAHLGVSERTAQRWAGEGMPLHQLRGKVQARPEELTSWVEAQRSPRTGT
ncbi:MAG: hypothetical protein IT379_23695 [Deltaproteobacteria bacterium]|nr:hypothetical protein [Deltaproteobacteria bacterium]